MVDKEQLQQEMESLREELEKQKKTNALLKKRILQGIVSPRGPKSTVDDRQERLALQETSGYELASRVKSVFFENVGHEIRSSMNGIMGMTDLVLQTELSANQRQYLEMVGSSVDRLLLVINEVLDFSKIESGQLDLNKEDFNLKQSLDHDLYLLSQDADKKNIKLDCTIDVDVPAFIHGDSVRLVQIITNLVTNGLRFTQQGGVRIHIENNGYDRENNLSLRFSIKDSGCGIEAEKLQLIQHYFCQQTDPHAVLPLSVGTSGLGLTVTSQLVKLMGGEIGVESDHNGSTFWFVLPFTEVADFQAIEEKANQTMETIQEEATYALRDARILLAEDEYINRILIETVLNQLGVTVSSVDNGEDAVRLACSDNFDMVLMDVQMEEVDGLEATRRIRKFEKGKKRHIPIIALTALAMGGDREKCLHAGMDDYISKPVEKKGLAEIMIPFLVSRALVVEAEPSSRSTLVRQLVEAGWQVTLAETKRHALYEAVLAHFDLIVFDLDTPQLAGLDAISVLRKLEGYSGRRSKILGIGQSENISGADLDGFLTRPIDKEVLQQQLETSISCA